MEFSVHHIPKSNTLHPIYCIRSLSSKWSVKGERESETSNAFDNNIYTQSVTVWWYNQKKIYYNPALSSFGAVTSYLYPEGEKDELSATLYSIKSADNRIENGDTFVTITVS